jgi:hypothetical protein
MRSPTFIFVNRVNQIDFTDHDWANKDYVHCEPEKILTNRQLGKYVGENGSLNSDPVY